VSDHLAREGSTKQCPSCTKRLDIAALSCRSCGHWFRRSHATGFEKAIMALGVLAYGVFGFCILTIVGDVLFFPFSDTATSIATGVGILYLAMIAALGLAVGNWATEGLLSRLIKRWRKSSQ
jgi:hypothetical protein